MKPRRCDPAADGGLFCRSSFLLCLYFPFEPEVRSITQLKIYTLSPGNEVEKKKSTPNHQLELTPPSALQLSTTPSTPSRQAHMVASLNLFANKRVVLFSVRFLVALPLRPLSLAKLTSPFLPSLLFLLVDIRCVWRISIWLRHVCI